MRCAVATCKVDNQSKSFNKQLMFFRFPKDDILSKQWLIACKRNDKVNLVNARVCSLHFTEENYARNLKEELLGLTPSKRKRILKPDAIPNINLPKQINIPKVSKCKNERSNRQFKRESAKLVQTILSADACANSNSNSNSNTETGVGGVDAFHETVPTEIANFNTENPSETLNVSVTKRDFGTNTENTDEETICKLKEDIEKLKRENQAFRSIFTENELKKLQNPQKRIKWTIEDISKAIVIYSAGARSYRMLLKKRYPLPAVSTLKKWCAKVKLEPGILKQVMMIVKKTELTSLQKLCILSFDEIKIKSQYLYNKPEDETLKPFNYVQVAMIRGLCGNWKQPIFYGYDCPMSKEKLFEIIDFVEQSGFPVVGMVCDLGGGNRSLHSNLGISITQTWFLNPTTNSKIYAFADVPHLIKLLRNHFVDQGFHLNGATIENGIIEELIKHTSTTDLNIAHKVSMETLHVKGAQRQKVKHATKLFSHTLSRAITRCGTLGKLNSKSWLECAEFFKDVNDWFDCLNVRVPIEDSRDRKKAYGMSLDLQNSNLDKMTNNMLNMRVQGRKALLPFQKGIIITNTSLKLLFEDLNTQKNVKYILTARLNQDVLENFFGAIRSKGGLHDHPNALEFKYRLRAYVLGKNDDSISEFGNTQLDNTPNLEPNERLLSKQCFSQLFSSAENASDSDPLIGEIEDLKYDGLENLAGFICNKLKKEEPGIERNTENYFSWTDHLSEGGLSRPSEDFMKKMEELEKIFNEVNSDSIFICKGYIQNLLSKASHVECSEKAKKLFFRSRMYFRMRKLNKELQDKEVSKKRKLKKVTT